jgi:hypothetical protein
MAIRATLLRTRLRNLLLAGAGAVLISLAAAPLHSQVVQVRPIAKLSLPTRISLQDGTLHVSQKVGIRFGARMTLTFNDRFDITNAVTYSPGYATLHGGGKRFELKTGAHSLTGSTAARYWLRPPDGRFSWEVHTGVGLVFGGQPSYMDLLDASTLSLGLGTGVRYQVGRLVSFTLGLNQRLLKLRFGEVPAGSSRPFKMAFGIGLPFLENLRPRTVAD